MPKSVFFRSYPILLLCILTIPFGCSGHRIYYKLDYTNRFYTPVQIPIKPGMILKPEFNTVCTVTIINDQSNDKKIPIGAYTHQWWGNLRMWTDTAIGVLSKELKKRDVKIIEESPKRLKLSITRAKLHWGFRIIGCTLNLRVETGDGYVVNLEETLESTDLYDSSDGAVTRAVAAMFNDQEIRGYLTSSLVEKDSDCDGVPDGRDRCAGTALGVRVDEQGCLLDSDGDGVPDDMDECPGTPQGLTVDSRGCPPDTDGDGVPDYRDECPGTPKGAWVDERGCWVIADPLFDFDQYEIKPQYYSILDRVVTVLKRNPSLNIEIQGHTCNMGTVSYNQRLSENRAQAIKQYLMSRGIDEDRLHAVGYGESKPKVSNETEAERVQNRRVELHPSTPR